MNRILDLPLFLRIPLCAIALSVIAIVFASKTFPAVPMVIIFAWAIAAVSVTGVLLIAYFVVVAGWNTWSVEHDAVDAQWFYDDSDSSGTHGLLDDSELPRATQD